MKILLADDHPLVREGLRMSLQKIAAKVEIVEACNYQEAIASASRDKDIDLVLMDLSMPDMDFHSGLKALREELPDVPIVVLSASENPRHVWEALDAGARGYIPKTCGKEVMLGALQLILSGGIYLPPTVLSDTRERHRVKHRPGDATPIQSEPRAGGALGLTDRQLDVLRLLIKGLPNKKIAAELDISPATVKAHVNAIFKTLNVSSRTEAVHVSTGLGVF